MRDENEQKAGETAFADKPMQERAERMAALPERSLNIVDNMLRALEQMNDNRYPFLGNFLNVREEESTDPEVFVCSMPITREIMNPLRIVYGGVTATLADMAMAWMLEFRLGRGARFVTIDMHVNYHHAGTGQRLIARSSLVNQAREVYQASCEIHNDRGELVSTATATFLHLPRGKAGE